MMGRVKADPYIIAAILITVANVILIWTFRFLPLYDYPIWLYEVRIMRALSEPVFRDVYEIIQAPVPNLGFVGPVWLLSLLFPIEVSGKLFLSFCVVALPWTFWRCARKISGDPQSAIAYFAFPFAFNTYFFAGNAYLLGIVFLLFMATYYVPKLSQLEGGDWIIVSFLLLVGYFLHAFSFILLVLVFASGILFLREWKAKVSFFCISLVPSVLCLLWYGSVMQGQSQTSVFWSAWGLAQNILKPLFLFVKSYAISNPVPLTVLNAIWLCIVGVFLISVVTAGWKSSEVDRRFVLPTIVTFLFAMFLPSMVGGVNEPGVRFGLPSLFFVLLMFSRTKVGNHWKTVFLAAALTANIHNTFYFKRVDEQMQELYRDITTHVNMQGKSFRTYRFDYPPSRDLRDIAAASVDPLFGVSSYAAIETDGGPTWIFGTSLLTYAEGHKHLNIAYTSNEPGDLAREMFSESVYSLPYDVTILVGDNPIVDDYMATYQAKKFRGKHWWVLEPLHTE
jgi:hypothetical protein